MMGRNKRAAKVKNTYANTQIINILVNSVMTFL